MAIQNKSGGVKPEMLGRPAFMSDRNAAARDTVYRAPPKREAPAKKSSGGSGGSGGHKKGSGGGTPKLPTHAPVPTPNPMLANMQTPTSAPGFAEPQNVMQTPTSAPGFAVPPSTFPARPDVIAPNMAFPNMQTPTSAPGFAMQGMNTPTGAPGFAMQGMNTPTGALSLAMPGMNTPTGAPGPDRGSLAAAMANAGTGPVDQRPWWKRALTGDL